MLAACGDGGSTDPATGSSTSTEAEADTTAAGSSPDRSGSGRGGVELTEIGSFDSPLHVAQPPGEDEAVYVVEQGGTIERVSPDGESTTFLDISDEITSGGEQGLLSVAFSPDWERDHLLYVDYTDPSGDTRIVEYEASSDGAEVDPGSARELLRVEQPYPNHNGGLVLFGPDDRLYIGLGDGGSADDPDRNGQDPTTLLGKILRVDPRPDGDLPYTVPADNPFAGDPEARGEIFATGLRNPWRFSFDPVTDDLLIGDVGQEEQEEVDVVTAEQANGGNFGWSALEGDARFNEDQEAPGAIAPALIATHEDGNCSITGGVVVRDDDLPTLDGRYLWGDFCLGELRSFTPEPGKRARDDVALGERVEGLSSFGTDNDGNVYAVSINGPVYRLDPAG